MVQLATYIASTVNSDSGPWGFDVYPGSATCSLVGRIGPNALGGSDIMLGILQKVNVQGVPSGYG